MNPPEACWGIRTGEDGEGAKVGEKIVIQTNCQRTANMDSEQKTDK
jgi:hypothetical protein